jgi:hypothetical protein
MCDDFGPVIYEYTLKQAIEDGVLVEIFKSDWEWLTKGKPVVATASIVADIPELELKKMWNQFVKVRNITIETHDTYFANIAYNGVNVWIIEDGAAVTYMYPSEY